MTTDSAMINTGRTRNPAAPVCAGGSADAGSLELH